MDPLSPWLIEKIQSGEAILFLGAGASKGAKDSSGRDKKDKKGTDLFFHYEALN